MKFLFFSPIGINASPLLDDTINRFSDAGADILLSSYDGWMPSTCRSGIKKVAFKGSKWEAAKAFLHRDLVSDYDFIFTWDDDLAISDFDPLRFLRIMETNLLDLAQPSILSPYALSHEITRQKPCGRIVREGMMTAGRFTNFVEIMAPVFSGRGWFQMQHYLGNGNPEGLGLDYTPTGQRGIVDCMHVIHTRPVRKKSERMNADRNRFCAYHGLRIYQHVEMGSLLEETQEKARREAVHF